MSSGAGPPSRLVLGSAQWGQEYGIANRHGPPDEHELGQILATAAAAGIRAIDTARGYGPSEGVVGRLTSGDARWEIVTKLADDLPVDDGSAAEALEAARQSLIASMEALRRDRLAVVLLHRASHRLAHDGAIWRLLRKERERGTIGSIGVSANSPEEAFALLDDPQADAVQVATSLLDQRLLRAGFFERARERSLRVFVRSVFLQGVAHLSPAELPEHLAGLGPPLAAIRDWAVEHDLPPTTPYLQFARRLHTEVVIGVERHHQLLDNLAAWEAPGVPGDTLRSLADAVPELDRELLTPSLWPRGD